MRAAQGSRGSIRIDSVGLPLREPPAPSIRSVTPVAEPLSIRNRWFGAPR